MHDDRQALLSILARLDQLDAEAEMMIGQVANPELLQWAENLRELLAKVGTNVIEQLHWPQEDHEHGNN